MSENNLMESASTFFSSHLGFLDWNSAGNTQKQAALDMAQHDINQAIAPIVLDSDDQLFLTALFEQALFLLKNYREINALKIIKSESIDGVGSAEYKFNSPSNFPPFLAPRAIGAIEAIKQRFSGGISRG